MDADIKAKWTTALRSGKIRQGKETLARLDRNRHLRRCCLGVLCDVAGAKRTKTQAPWRRTASYEYNGMSGTEYLPDTLANKLGLPREIQTKLATMNDSSGLSFREIADWVDKNL